MLLLDSDLVSLFVFLGDLLVDEGGGSMLFCLGFRFDFVAVDGGVFFLARLGLCFRRFILGL